MIAIGRIDWLDLRPLARLRTMQSEAEFSLGA
jgi:hypothetical protein